jgi:hypothetical protein
MPIIHDVLRRSVYIMQRDLFQFEENLASYLGVNTFEIKSLAFSFLENLPINLDVATKEWIACAT